MMRLSDIQPQYFPRIHYFARMLSSDVFVLRDDVQFVRNHKYPGGQRCVSYQAHTPISGSQGTLLLAVAVKKGHQNAIDEVAPCYEQKWRSKHLNQIRQHYRSAPRSKELMPEIETLVTHQFSTLADLNIATICWSLGHILGAPVPEPGMLSVDTINSWLTSATNPTRLRRVERGTQLDAGGLGDTPSERIAQLCKVAGASEYLAGGTAVETYLDNRPFEEKGVQITVQDWQCPNYRHQNGSSESSNLSVLDLLLNVDRPLALFH